MSETTLASLPAGTFAAPVSSYDQPQVDAINAIVSAQNANNTSLRSDINTNTTAIATKATNPVVSSQLDPTTIQYATVTLSNAELLALFATPKVVVAAQGANTLIEFVSAVLEYIKSTAFTIGSAGNVTINYKADASGAAVSVARAATGFFDQSTSQSSNLAKLTTNINTTSLTNQPLVLTVATADMTGGSGSTGLLKIAYRVHTGIVA